MTSTYYFFTDRERLPEIQRIVKRQRGVYFKNDPNRWPAGRRVYVVIESDDVHALNAVKREMNRREPPAPPPPLTWRQRLVAWFKSPRRTS